MTPLESLVASGTKLWLDSIDPKLVADNFAFGATGATSNPIIVSGLIGEKAGRFDSLIKKFLEAGDDDSTIAWKTTDQIVGDAQKVFHPVWEKTKCNDGWVSFELDPLLEDHDCKLSIPQRSAKYVELGKHWSAGKANRMIKIPATPAGLGAVEDLCAAGVTLNVTLIFSERQYVAARDAMWRGAQKRKSLDTFKSVYSIFVSRLDVYSEQKAPDLSPAAQNQVGILNAKRIWAKNAEFWADKKLPLQQEMIFASTGAKEMKKFATPAAWHYVAAFAGSDIETNPPGTNDAVQASKQTFTRQVDVMPSQAVQDEIDAKINWHDLEETLMREGLSKFAEPQKQLLAVIAAKRKQLSPVAVG